VELTQREVDDFMAADKVVADNSPMAWKTVSESSVLYRGPVEVGAAQVGQVALYVNPNFLRHWFYALSFHDEIVYEVHVSPPPTGHGNPPDRPKPRFPRRVTSAEHEHIWIEGLETRCALPMDGFEQATHREMLDEFCKRARIEFRPEYRDPVKGVQLRI
jgi:hypothetical protein